MVYIYIKWPHIYNFLKNNIAKVCTYYVYYFQFPVPKEQKKLPSYTEVEHVHIYIEFIFVYTHGVYTIGINK